SPTVGPHAPTFGGRRRHSWTEAAIRPVANPTERSSQNNVPLGDTEYIVRAGGNNQPQVGVNCPTNPAPEPVSAISHQRLSGDSSTEEARREATREQAADAVGSAGEQCNPAPAPASAKPQRPTQHIHRPRAGDQGGRTPFRHDTPAHADWLGWLWQ